MFSYLCLYRSFTFCNHICLLKIYLKLQHLFLRMYLSWVSLCYLCLLPLPSAGLPPASSCVAGLYNLPPLPLPSTDGYLSRYWRLIGAFPYLVIYILYSHVFHRSICSSLSLLHGDVHRFEDLGTCRIPSLPTLQRRKFESSWVSIIDGPWA